MASILSGLSFQLVLVRKIGKERERERERDEIRDARNEGQFSITGRGEIASLANR